MKTKTIHGLILAAGLSSRMGDFKPLMPFHGKTLLESSIDSMLLAGVGRVVVVVGHQAERLERMLQSRYLGDSVRTAYNRDYAATDMLASIKVGLRALPACDAFFLLPGDMPVIRKETYLALARAMPAESPAIVFPTLEGYRKHPPLVASALIDEILRFEQEGGLREFWKGQAHLCQDVAVDDAGCWADLDTFAEYTRCLNRYTTIGQP